MRINSIQGQMHLFQVSVVLFLPLLSPENERSISRKKCSCCVLGDKTANIVHLKDTKDVRPISCLVLHASIPFFHLENRRTHKFSRFKGIFIN